MGDIVVVGNRYYAANASFWGALGVSQTSGPTDYMGRQYSDGSEEIGPAPIADQDEVTVYVNLDRPLTAREEAAIMKLKGAIADKAQAIKNLPNDAYIINEDGSTTTGAEVKAAWKMTDFVINPDSVSYDNQSGRSEASYNFGNQQVSINIGFLQTYDNVAGGMSYLVGHELGHLVSASLAYQHLMASDGIITTRENEIMEGMSNTLAQALARFAHETPMADPGYGYPSAGSGSFYMPPYDDGGSGGGGDGGSGDPGPGIFPPMPEGRMISSMGDSLFII